MLTVTSYSPSGKSLSASRSMWISNVSPTLDAGDPVDPMSMPDASMATWPSGSRRTAKIAPGSALMVRSTSMRSTASLIAASFHSSWRACALAVSVPRATGARHAARSIGRVANAERLVELQTNVAEAVDGTRHVQQPDPGTTLPRQGARRIPVRLQVVDPALQGFGVVLAQVLDIADLEPGTFHGTQ